MRDATLAGTRRPAPPAEMLSGDGVSRLVLAPAPALLDWALTTFVLEDGTLRNEEHAHLEHADLCMLWASSGFGKQGRTVLGQAEQVMFRASGWQKARQEQQVVERFGRVPSFLITIDASYAATCSDNEFCALIEHELSHIGQERDDFGQPAFKRDGTPKLAMRSHDVEEFVGVVRRYGPSEDVLRLVEAAKNSPSCHASQSRERAAPVSPRQLDQMGFWKTSPREQQR